MKWAWVLVMGLGVLGLGSYVGTGELFSLGLDAWDAGMAGAGLALAAGPGALFLNPAGLAGETGLQLWSTFGSTFGQASTSTVAVSLAWLGVGGLRLSLPPDGGTPFLHEGALLGVGIPISPGFSIGARGRLLHLVHPGEHTGWALDVAALYRGPVSAALMVEGAVAQAPTPGEEWPSSLSLGLAFQVLGSDRLSAQVALAATGIGAEAATLRLGGELWVGELGLRCGLSPDLVAIGVSAGWRNFRLNLAVELSAALSAAFFATLIVRFG